MKNIEQKKVIWQIILFSILVLTLAFLGPLLGGSPSKPGIGFIIWGVAPALVAILMRIITRDWSDAGFKPAIRKNLKWYIFIILACSVIMVLNLVFGKMISAASVSDFSIVKYLNSVLPGIGVFLVFASLEEIGWRGYLVPKFAKIGINGYVASAVISVIWATWHMPYLRELLWVSNNSGDIITFIPRFYLVMFAYSILYYELRIITGSIWSAILLHAFTNAIQHPMDFYFFKIVPGMEYLVSFNGFFIGVLVALIGVALNRWRIKNVKYNLDNKY